MITRNTYTQGKGELEWDTWPIRLVLKLSLQSENETNDPLKSGPALAGPAGLATPPLYIQGFVGPALYAGLYLPYIIRRAAQAMLYMQGCPGPALHAGLCRPCSICRSLEVLHYMQGCAGPALSAGLFRHFSIRRDVQAQYSTQGCTVPALFARL